MKRSWNIEELEQEWVLLAQEKKLLKNSTGANRLGFAVLIKYFQMTGRFPDDFGEVPRDVIRFVADQLEIPSKAWRDYVWDGRAAKYHRSKIRDFFGYRKASQEDAKVMIKWLVDEFLHQGNSPDRLQLAVLERYRDLRIEPPATEQIRRLIQSALSEHERRFCEKIGGNFDTTLIGRLDALLQIQSSDDGEWTVWQTLKSDPGKAGIDVGNRENFSL